MTTPTSSGGMTLAQEQAKAAQQGYYDPGSIVQYQGAQYTVMGVSIGYTNGVAHVNGHDLQQVGGGPIVNLVPYSALTLLAPPPPPPPPPPGPYTPPTPPPTPPPPPPPPPPSRSLNHGWLMAAGDYLRVGEWMFRGGGPSNNSYAATLLASGDVVLCYGTSGSGSGPDLSRRYYSLVRDAGQAHLVDQTWQFNPAQTDGQYIAIMQTDGNLVLYRGTDPAHLGAPYWASNTNQPNPTGHYCASLGPDGNLRVHNADTTTLSAAPDHPESTPIIWQTGLTYPAQRASGGNCLHTYQWLATGDYLISANGRHAALLQSDGNWVLCAAGGVTPVPDHSRPYWSAYVQGAANKVGNAVSGPLFVIMQNDTNFVLYNGEHPPPGPPISPYWATDQGGPRPTDSVAVLRNDGSFAVLPGTDPNGTASARYQTAVAPPNLATSMIVQSQNFGGATVQVTVTNLGGTGSGPATMTINVHPVQPFSYEAGAGTDCTAHTGGIDDSQFVCPVPAIPAGGTYTRQLTIQNLTNQAPHYVQTDATTTMPGDTSSSDNTGYAIVTLQ